MTPTKLLLKLSSEKKIKYAFPIDLFKIAKLVNLEINFIKNFSSLKKYTFSKKNNIYYLDFNLYEIDIENKEDTFYISYHIMKIININKKLSYFELEKYAFLLISPFDLFKKEVMNIIEDYYNKKCEKHFIELNSKMLEINLNDPDMKIIEGLSKKINLSKEKVLFLYKKLIDFYF